MLLTALVALTFPVAASQTRSVEFELGFNGAVVADAWNPLRLVLRDLPPVWLEVLIDQGSLRSGPILMRYLAPVEAGGGLSTFEDTLFVPSWRSLTWTVSTAERTVASGSLDARQSDPRPLTLLVSARSGRLLPLLPAESRTGDIPPTALPSSASAYSGVSALLLDGTTPPPRPEALVAAAAAGVHVVLIEPLPATFDDLALLSAAGPRRVGAGWIASAAPESLAAQLRTLPRFPLADTADRLAEATADRPAGPLSRLIVVATGAGYALLILVLLRYGGYAGLPTALIVALLAAGAGWFALRPGAAISEESRSITAAAGGIGLTLPALALRSLPGGRVSVEGRLRPVRQVEYTVARNSIDLELTRWAQELFLARPLLATAEFEWDGHLLTNRGDHLLTDVLIVGTGPQPSLAPGQARPPVSAEEDSLPRLYGELLPLLPSGTALASAGERVFVALPPYPGAEL
jgi:hypothetical protein